MTWEHLCNEIAEYRKKLESKLHRKAKLSGIYVAVWGQGGFTLEGWIRASDAEMSRAEIFGDGSTIGKLFDDARKSLTDGMLAKYLKKPKSSGSRGKKKHK